MEEKERIATIGDLIAGSKWVMVGLAVVTLAVYGNSLTGEFVSDDLTSITTNPLIGNFWKNMVSRASITDGIKSIIYRVSGTNPFLYHLNNLSWHFGVSVLVYFLIRLLSGSKKVAVVSAFLFALHPIHTEAVTWVSGDPYLVSSFFFLVALGLLVAVDQGLVRRRWLILSLILSLVSYFASEKTLVLSGVIFAYELVYGSFKKAVLTTIPYLAVAGVFVWTWLARLSQVISERTGPTSVAFNPLVQMPLAIVTYLKLLIWPMALTLYHEAFELTPEEVYFNGLVILAAVILAWFLYSQKRRFLFFLEALFFLGLVPTLLPFSISWIVAERYVYLSSIGFVAALAWGLVWLGKKSQSMFWLVLIGLTSFYAVRTIIRNMDWQNQDTLWPATVAVSPLSSIAHNNMGDYYFRHGDFPMAVAEFSRAIEIRPDYADATHNLGNTYMTMGEATVAGQLFARALKLNPAQWRSALSLGSVDLSLGDLKGANQALVQAQEINPNSPEIYNTWAIYYFQMGDKAKALEMVKKALAIDPTYQPAQKNLEILSR